MRSENLRQETAATETRQAFPAFLRDPPACSEGRTYSDEGQEMRMVPRRIHGSPLPDVGRPSGFLSSKHQPNYVAPDPCCAKTREVGAPCPIGRKCPGDIAPVDELVTEAEEYVRASDPLMAGMGDGKGEPWVPEKFVEYGNDGKPLSVPYPSPEVQAKLTKILEERGSRYGAFADNAEVSQGIKHHMQSSINWYNLAPDQREALDQIAAKISRMLTGDANYVDNWDDIAGFATLVAERLRSEK